MEAKRISLAEACRLVDEIMQRAEEGRRDAAVREAAHCGTLIELEILLDVKENMLASSKDQASATLEQAVVSLCGWIRFNARLANSDESELFDAIKLIIHLAKKAGANMAEIERITKLGDEN